MNMAITIRVHAREETEVRCNYNDILPALTDHILPVHYSPGKTGVILLVPGYMIISITSRLDIRSVLEHLIGRAHELRIRLDAARRWRDIIETRQQRQDTEEQIRRAFRREGVIRDLDQALEQAVSRSEEREAILEAARELEASSLDARLDRAQTEAQVENELQVLRARLAENAQQQDTGLE